jgi:hypothetical protein
MQHIERNYTNRLSTILEIGESIISRIESALVQFYDEGSVEMLLNGKWIRLANSDLWVKSKYFKNPTCRIEIFWNHDVEKEEKEREQWKIQ